MANLMDDLSKPDPADSQQVIITRVQLRRVLRDMGLTVTGTGVGDQVFDALRAGDGLED